MKDKFKLLAAAAALAGVLGPLRAAPIREVTGAYNGLDWQAHSTIVGVTSTAT